MTRGARWLVAMLLICACAPMPPLASAPDPVRTALDPFLTTGYRCTGPVGDHSPYAQWQCTTTSQGIAYSIVVDADASGLKNVLATVDQSQLARPAPAPAADFFGRVGDMHVGGSTDAVKGWIGSHATAGGRAQVGPVLVTLDASQPVASLNLFLVAPPSPPNLGTIDVHGEGGHDLELTILDRSTVVRSARSATRDELVAHDGLLGTSTISAANLDPTHVLVIWLGTSCDRAANVQLEMDLASIQLERAASPPCDLVPDPRGIVLGTLDPVRADQIKLAMAPAGSP